jgi:hypothetical protein
VTKEGASQEDAIAAAIAAGAHEFITKFPLEYATQVHLIIAAVSFALISAIVMSDKVWCQWKPALWRPSSTDMPSAGVN